jgi:peptidoglycan-associated lipoprotein
MKAIPQSPSRLHHLATTFVALAALTLATGCHKKTPAPPPSSMGPTIETGPAPTATLTADPSAIELGQSVALNWRTTNATTVTIDGLGPVVPNGTQMVSPSNSTNFHLVAKNDNGTTEANVRVTVRLAEAPAPMGDNSGGNAAADAIFHQNVQDAFFDYDSYELRPDAQAAATAAAAYLNQHPEIRVLVAGYADERGSAEYNLALGENRANAARTALVNAGVAANRIRIVSYGKEKQFCTEATESCWQQNRRAQFSIDR